MLIWWLQWEADIKSGEVFVLRDIDKLFDVLYRYFVLIEGW